MIGLLGYFFICTTAIFLYSTYNTMKKLEHFEEIIEEQDIEYFNLRMKVRNTIQLMRKIDSTKAFEKDDSVGSVFQELLNIIEDIEDEDAS